MQAALPRCIATLRRCIRNWNERGSAVATVMRWLRSWKNDSASSPGTPQCLNRNWNESVKGGKRRVFGRLPWFRVVRHKSRSQHCSVKGDWRLTYRGTWNPTRGNVLWPMATRTVKPSGNVQSSRHNEFGSSNDGTLAETSALLIRSLTALWRIWRPADFLQARPCVPSPPTWTPQTHVCGAHMMAPRQRAIARQV